MKVLSLGWGVQSFTLAAMSALGDIERVDAVIHADTTHEFSGTYEFSTRWKPWLEARGMKVITTISRDAQTVKQVVSKWTDIPAYTLRKTKKGKLRRQCTHQWKIVAMRRCISSELKRHNIKKLPGVVEQWIGISLDEYYRMKPSDVKYIINRWPLVEKRMTRHDCKIWLEKHNLEIPPRSACTFCPFHDTAEWRRIRTSPIDWGEAVNVDRAIRKVRPPYDLFIHPSRKPLEELDLRTQEEKGQLRLWDEECTGMCGV